MMAAAPTADGVLTTYATVDRELIQRLPHCRIVARAGIGVDNVDLDAARERGIIVTNVPDYCIEEVAHHALALVLASVRRLHLADELVRRGRWSLQELRPIPR